MPSGRDSFRRNRVAPSVQFYFTTSARLWGVCPLDRFRLSVNASNRSERWETAFPAKLGGAPSAACFCKRLWGIGLGGGGRTKDCGVRTYETRLNFGKRAEREKYLT